MLKQYFFSNPKQRIKQLQIGVGVFAFGVCSLYVSAQFESQWFFFFAAVIMGIGIMVALPAYIAFLLWRVRTSLQQNHKD